MFRPHQGRNDCSEMAQSIRLISVKRSMCLGRHSPPRKVQPLVIGRARQRYVVRHKGHCGA
ncbi:hypothetical protein BC936DRAFT_147670 [Jimgerdemannia flammicorona]|uniref:Uncharacterized protein n=2 Tax=Jimgerdemannia flammicorona TaxID=994334 RepID=A0A433D4S9_9FUNG|nr:hypothetical protein BC936DRAFT_147670 [Jimgerdemannia flammicorona]RUS27055.1 hypothetical protein BC938DRAFT_483769 [Jimgerdemannia flammicorona]